MHHRTLSVESENRHGRHRLVYHEWGAPDNSKVLLCVHGLARCARDFARLALALAGEYRVVAPDMAGRGASDWLPDKLDYGYPQYMRDIQALLEAVRPATLHWLGTSMGGMLGMIMAAQPGSRIEKLVLNDVGAVLAADTVRYLQGWFGRPQRFVDMYAAEQYCRHIYAGFGDLSDEEWAEVAANTVRPAIGGGYELHYDPGIAEAVKLLPAQDFAVWEVWDAVRCPVLLLHGVESIVLSQATVDQMRGRGPALDVVSLPGVGHAPTLTRPDQIEAVRAWLLAEAPVSGALSG